MSDTDPFAQYAGDDPFEVQSYDTQADDPFAQYGDDPFAEYGDDPFAQYAEEDIYKQIAELNGNPKQKETVFVEGPNQTVELERGGIKGFFDFLGDSYNRSSDQVEKNELGFKHIFGSGLDDKEALRFAKLSEKKYKDLKPQGKVEYATQAIAEQIPVMMDLVGNAAKRGAQGGVIGAGVGFVGGNATGIGLALPEELVTIPGGALIGGKAGATYGVLEAGFVQMTYDAYEEFSQFKDDEGQPLDPSAAKIGALMVGGVNAGFEALPVGMIAKMVPGSEKIFKKIGVEAGSAIGMPNSTSAMRKFLISISRVAVAEGATEAAQESTQIAMGEVLKEFSGRDFEKITTTEIMSRLEEAAIKGAIAGAGISSPVAGVNAVVETRRENATARDEKTQEAPQQAQDNTERVQKSAENLEASTTETTAKIEEVKSEVEAGTITKEEGDAKIDEANAELEAAAEVKLKEFGIGKENREAIIKGRIDKLDNDINSLNKELDGLAKEIDTRKEEGKPTKALENKEKKLLDKYEAMDSERAELLTAEETIIAVTANKALTERGAAALAASKKTIEIKGEKLDRMSTKQQARALNKGLREGAKLARQDVKAAQTNVVNLVKESGLSAADKAKFITAVKNIQTSEQFTNQLPKLKSRIDSLLEKQAVRQEKSRVSKALSRKTIKPKIVSGRKVGKFDAEIQTKLESLQALNKVSGVVNQETGASEASLLLEQRMDAGIDDQLGNAILYMKANPNDVSSGYVSRVADQIEALLGEGRQRAKNRQLKAEQEAQEYKDIILAYNDAKGLKTQRKTGKLAQLKATGNFSRQVVARLTDGWDDLLDRIMPAETAQKLEIGTEVQKEKGIRREMGNKLVSAAMDAFGIKTARQAQKMLEESGKIEDHGVWTNRFGDEVRMEMSKSQARKLYMEYQDETLHDTIKGVVTEKGKKKGNGYSDEMLSYIFNNVLDAQDKAFAKAQLDIYQEFYSQINEVYERVYGIPLSKNLFYSPIRREVDANEIGVGEFGNDVAYRSKVANAKSLKIRQDGVIEPLALRSDIDVFQRHIMEMSRFIAMREKSQLLNRVFGDKEVRNTLEGRYGRDYMDLVHKHMESFVNGGDIAGDVFSRAVNLFNRNFAVAQLGGKAKIGLTQTASLFAYAEFVPTSAFVKGVRDFALNPKKVISVLGKSELMQARAVNIDADIARMGKVFDNKTLQRIQKKHDNFMDYMLIATKIGDRFTIYAGGWGVYQHVLDQTGSKEQAMAAFERATAKTQQSSDVDQTSWLQKSNPYVRGLTMFMSAPIAQFRGEIRAVRQRFFKKEISNGDFAKRMIIYHFILPGLYQALANGLVFGEWDNEDQIRAAMLGSLNGIPLMGDVMNAAFRKLQDKPVHGGDTVKWLVDLKGVFQEMFEAMDAGVEGDFEATAEALIEMGKHTAVLSGLPAAQAENVNKAMEDLEYGDMKAATMRFLGWPDGVVKNID